MRLKHWMHGGSTERGPTAMEYTRELIKLVLVQFEIVILFVGLLGVVVVVGYWPCWGVIKVLKTPKKKKKTKKKKKKNSTFVTSVASSEWRSSSQEEQGRWGSRSEERLKRNQVEIRHRNDIVLKRKENFRRQDEMFAVQDSKIRHPQESLLQDQRWNDRHDAFMTELGELKSLIEFNGKQLQSQRKQLELHNRAWLILLDGRVKIPDREILKIPIERYYGRRNVVTWTVMIGAYAESGCYVEAYRFFVQMKQEGFRPDSLTYVSILNPSASAGALEWDKEVHNHAINAGLESDLRVGQMYAKSGSLNDSRLVFHRLKTRDPFTWNILIGAYAEIGSGVEADQPFLQVKREGFIPDAITYVSILNASASAKALQWVKEVHSGILSQEKKAASAEPTSEVLSNPVRVVPAQEKYIKFREDYRYVPVKRSRPSGFVLLKDLEPSEPVELVSTY